jgi:hypothetical protein
MQLSFVKGYTRALWLAQPDVAQQHSNTKFQFANSLPNKGELLNYEHCQLLFLGILCNIVEAKSLNPVFN